MCSAVSYGPSTCHTWENCKRRTTFQAYIYILCLSSAKHRRCWQPQATLICRCIDQDGAVLSSASSARVADILPVVCRVWCDRWRASSRLDLDKKDARRGLTLSVYTGSHSAMADNNEGGTLDFDGWPITIRLEQCRAQWAQFNQ